MSEYRELVGELVIDADDLFPHVGGRVVAALNLCAVGGAGKIPAFSNAWALGSSRPAGIALLVNGTAVVTCRCVAGLQVCRQERLRPQIALKAGRRRGMRSVSRTRRRNLRRKCWSVEPSG